MNGAFPVPLSRKVLRKRYHSPPCLRNSFLHGSEDAAPALPKAPLPASRYRYSHQSSAVRTIPWYQLVAAKSLLPSQCIPFMHVCVMVSNFQSPDPCCRAEFKEIRLLGTGNFSKVYLAQHRLDGANYALKRSAHRVCPDAAIPQWV